MSEAIATRPSSGYSTRVRLEIENQPGMLGKVAAAIGEAGGDIGEVTLVGAEAVTLTREITIKAGDAAHAERIAASIREVKGVRVLESQTAPSHCTTAARSKCAARSRFTTLTI